MARKKLTAGRLRDFECPNDIRQAFLWDAVVPGLGVRATAGAKVFIFQTRLAGRSIRVKIGDVRTWAIDSADPPGARQEARRLQTLVDRGIDPREQKRQKQQERETARKEAARAKDKTLEALLTLYADYCMDQGKRRHAVAVRSACKCHLVEADPDLAKTPAKDVTPRDIASLVRRVLESGKTRTAGIFRSYLAAAFTCARKAPVSAGLPANFIDFDIESNPVAPVPAIPVNARDRTLTKDEFRAYLGALKGDGTIDALLRLAVYAGGQRVAQLLRAEVKHYNPDEKTLTLFDPKGNRKVPREHIVPLGAMGDAIIAALVEKAQRDERSVLFTSPKGTPLHIAQPGKRVSEISTAMAGETFNLLDIRRTIETMLAGLGVTRDIRAQLLSHGISGVQATHYDRHSYSKEKRATIRKWEIHLKRLMEGEDKKVINMAEAKRQMR